MYHIKNGGIWEVKPFAAIFIVAQTHKIAAWESLLLR
jgi:hypothetical protein